jgi:hypothetical protein
MVQGYDSDGGGKRDDREDHGRDADGDDDDGHGDGGRRGQNQPNPRDALFLVTPCPGDSRRSTANHES